MPVACHSGPCHIWAASLTLLPPDQKYNSLGALCDSVLIAPSLLHRESGAVSRPIPSQLMMPYWFSGPLSLLYQHIPVIPRFVIIYTMYHTERVLSSKIYMINETEINITHTPSPMPTTIPVRKALPSSSITGSNLILYPLSESTYRVYTRVKGLSSTFAKKIFNYFR